VTAALDAEFLRFSGDLGERKPQARAVTNHAVPALLVIVVLLLCLRQSYIVPSTGLGLSPAYLLSLFAGVWWLLAKTLRLPGLGADGLPIRFAIGVQLLTQLVGYVVLLEHPNATVNTHQVSVLTPVILAGLAIFVADTVQTPAELDRVVRWLVIAGSFGALLAVVGTVAHVDLAAVTPPGLRSEPQLSAPIPRAGVDRAQGTAAHPLELAAVMTVLFPLALYCVVSAQYRGRSWWPWLGMLLVIVAAGGLSVSRSFFVGVGVSVLVLAMVWPLRRIGMVLLAGGLALVVLLIGDTRAISSLVTLFLQGSADDSLQHRGFALTFVMNLISHHPWFGMGWGSYDTSRYPVLDDQYLGVLAETGIVGLLGFLLFLGGGVYAALARSSRLDRRAWDIGPALAASITAYAVVNLILDTGGFEQISALAAILVGLAGATYRYHLRGQITAGKDDARTTRRPPPARPPREKMGAAR
jgi:putative inorganic carbon (HCO3(-)) transporter